MNDYQLIDSGHGQKLEKFGNYILIRPCPQAVWRPKFANKWHHAHATFNRENRWQFREKLPSFWEVEHAGVKFKVQLTDFGHLGVFAEHAGVWQEMRQIIKKPCKVLNLFAYSGGVTLAAAQMGAEVCHLDASKGMVDWARENAALNGLEKAPIRWIVDDAMKFLAREQKRGSFYDGIILDPPTFGRGAKGEVFKIEEQILPLLELCKSLLSKNPQFVFFSCHTPGFTPICLSQLLSQVLPSGKIDAAEMKLTSQDGFSVPSGAFAKWVP
jgi:23S rRNA (cytosine1962-C5)-methyltransferase